MKSMSSRILATAVSVVGLFAASCDTGSSVAASPAGCVGQIGNRVWKDQNGNGIQDAGEAGLEGIVVTLTTALGGSTTTTSSTGEYTFGSLCAETYTISVATPAGLTPTTPGVGMDETIDSETSPAVVVLSENDSVDLTIDFGFTGTGSIGDRVWIDKDCNGLQDPGEVDLDGVPVTLTDTNGAMRTTSTVGGFYWFGGLCAGDYVVTVDDTNLACLSPTLCDQGSDDTIDSECSPVLVNLPTDDTQDDSIDFGYCPTTMGTASVGDFVWHDLNGDGIQDPGEPGIPGLMVFLEDSGSNPVARVQTDANGRYLFSGLCPGNYLIEIVATPCFVPMYSPVLFTLGAGTQNLSVDFGYSQIGTASIGDFVWDDLNADGIQDPGEPGLEGAIVRLFDDGGQLLLAERTDRNGAYVFGSLCGGAYDVTVNALPAGPALVPSPCRVGPNRAVDSNCSPARVILPFDDTQDLTIDFGYHNPIPSSQ